MKLEEIEEALEVLEKDFVEVRARVQKAVDASPTSVTFEDALRQVRLYLEMKMK